MKASWTYPRSSIPVEWAWARDFIAWREAITYRETAPHEYVVRKWEAHEQGNGDLDRFVALVRRFGFADFYYEGRHIYWVIDKLSTGRWVGRSRRRRSSTGLA